MGSRSSRHRLSRDSAIADSKTIKTQSTEAISGNFNLWVVKLELNQLKRLQAEKHTSQTLPTTSILLHNLSSVFSKAIE